DETKHGEYFRQKLAIPMPFRHEMGVLHNIHRPLTDEIPSYRTNASLWNAVQMHPQFSTRNDLERKRSPSSR
ncbi:MAG TPA: hypothetical protein VGO27_14260, partial [Candidatus Acidoferrum sp.]|nr:hypothetical protein [Candidatus Acidoferrum sp.]